MNLYHNEVWSIESEGRFFIVTYRTNEGKKEKVFETEDEAKKFTNNI